MSWVLLNFVTLEIRAPVHSNVYQKFISRILLIYKLVHTHFRGNKYLKYRRDSQRTGVKVEKKQFQFRKENGGTKSK